MLGQGVPSAILHDAQGTMWCYGSNWDWPQRMDFYLCTISPALHYYFKSGNIGGQDSIISKYSFSFTLFHSTLYFCILGVWCFYIMLRTSLDCIFRNYSWGLRRSYRVLEIEPGPATCTHIILLLYSYFCMLFWFKNSKGRMDSEYKW